MSTITIDLDKDRLARLKAWAKEVGMPPEELASNLLDQQLYAEDMEDFTPEQRAAIEEGLRDASEGRLVSHEDVMAKARKILVK